MKKKKVKEKKKLLYIMLCCVWTESRACMIRARYTEVDGAALQMSEIHVQ